MSDTQENDAQNSDTKNVGDGDTKSEHIQLKVVGQDGNEVHFRVKKTTELGKLKRSYSERVVSKNVK
ncbi:small ubiquitin-related modifier-like protein [Leptotrombidium deliense]|uniref:Small ubiquitin-related modifier-like protein n=1 Tax=Leptotrombidium deliense TaxID=299467 RepID=A0A443S2Q9_9ACAR|nr:small ubiquitin-related modifier-like protein [Leptotrombidium deliense]